MLRTTRQRLAAMVTAMVVTITTLLAGSAPVAAGPVEQKRAEAAALVTKLEQQARRITGLDRSYRMAYERAQSAEALTAKAATDLANVLRRNDEARARLVADAQLAYVLGGASRLLNLTSPGGSPEAVSRAAYLRLVSGRERQSLGALRALREDLTDQRERLTRARESVRLEAEQAHADRLAAQRAISAQRSLLSRVNGQLAQLVKQEQLRRDAAASEARRRATQASVSGGPASPPKPRFVPDGPDSQPGVVDDVFACIRQLESGNRYGSVGGGAYQFQDATWQSLGYTGSARDAPPHVQDEAARRLQIRDGWRPWTTAPLCGRP